jgi:glycosyltransferase involved in cell wall biosynthesis
MAENKRLKVCYVLAYYVPDYVRTKTLTEALKRIDRIGLYQVKNSLIGRFRHFQTLSRLLIVRFIHNPDYYLLGFRGHEIFWPVRIITLGKPLIFDQMMSPYDSLLNERKKIKKGGMIEKLTYRYEQSILRYSDVILTDTTIHKEYFAGLFRVNPDKIRAIPVGADEDLFKKLPIKSREKKDILEVLFYGSFLPLHGVDIILNAASILKDKPIRFTLVGGKGKDLSNFHQLIKQLELKNIAHQEWVDYEKLPGLIGKTDLCLGGPFGNTGQARRVVTGKTFQFLAMGKPTVIGQIEQDYGFEDKKNCLLVRQGDAQALAEAILWGFNHQRQLEEIGQQGRELYTKNFSIANIKKRIEIIFQT